MSGSVTALRSGEDTSNQWMGVAVASQRSPLGRALVSRSYLPSVVSFAVHPAVVLVSQ